MQQKVDTECLEIGKILCIIREFGILIELKEIHYGLYTRKVQSFRYV